LFYKGNLAELLFYCYFEPRNVIASSRSSQDSLERSTFASWASSSRFQCNWPGEMLHVVAVSAFPALPQPTDTAAD
jgi:hypothetical protein